MVIKTPWDEVVRQHQHQVAAIWWDAQRTARQAAEKGLGLFWAGQPKWRAVGAREQGK